MVKRKQFQGCRSGKPGQMLQRGGERRRPNGQNLKHESCTRVSLEWWSQPGCQGLKEPHSEGILGAVSADLKISVCSRCQITQEGKAEGITTHQHIESGRKEPKFSKI